MTAKKNLSCSLLLASALLALPSLKATLPITTSANLTVSYPSTVGTVTTSPVGGGGTGTLTITSSAATTVLSWGNFWDGTANGGTASTGTSDSIIFNLTNGNSSSILNVISGGNPTTLNANVSSNGKLFFLNTSGITIGSNATINAAGFYASTVNENISYFEQNGSLQVFSSTPPVQTTSGAIIVQSGATLATNLGTGDVRLAGNGITLAGGTITGNVYLVDTGSSTPNAVDLATVAGEHINATGGSAGNLTITTTNGAVDLSDGFGTTVQGNLVVTSNGGTVDIGTAGGTNVTGTASITTTGTSGNGNITETAGTLTVDGNAATFVTGTGSGATDGTISITSANINDPVISITGGATTINANASADSLTFGNVTVSGNLSITTSFGLTTQNFGSTASTPAVVTVNGTNSTIALAADTDNIGSKTLKFNGSGAENFVTLTMGNATDSATITTTGNITLSTAAAVSVPTLSLTTTSGTITQTTGGAPGSIGSAVTSLTVNAPTITLANTSNAFSSVKLLGASGGATLTDDASTLTIANGTAVTGNATITNEHISGTGATNIALGTIVGDSLSFGGNLNLNLTWAAGVPATQEVQTNAGTLTVSGNTTVVSAAQASVAANDLVQLGNSGTVTPSYTFTGPIGITYSGAPGSLAGNINIFGTSALVLNTVNTGSGATLTVASTLTGTGNSGISNPSGTVTAGAAVTLAAGTLASPSNIQIGTTTSPAALTGTITDNTANNLTLVNSLATTIAAGTNPITGQTSITQTGAGAASAVTINASLANLSIADTGTSPTGNVSVTIPTGNVALSNWTVGGNSTVTPTVTVTNGSITLGAGINDVNLGATTFTSTGSLAGISDTASSPVLIYGAVIFNSDGAINVSNNTSSSLGGISLNATTTDVAHNNSNMTYIEGSGVNLQAISVPAGYTGTISVTSVNSIVLETATSVLTLPTGTLTLTANSVNGAVLLNNTSATNAIQAATSITAVGNSAFSTDENMTLGNINITAGNFTADSTALANATISEGTGATVVVSGAASFVTDGGALSVALTGNKFGSLTIDTTDAGATLAGANATIKQNTTAVVTQINTGTAGNLSITDETGSITETGNLGVQVGGTTTLAATAGGVTFNATGNNFSGQALTITATGNAAVTDANAVTELGGGTDVTGSLTVTNNNTGAEIKDNGSNGNVTVGGTIILLTPTSAGSFVNFVGTNNSIAGVEIKAGNGTTTFYDNAALILEPGTVIVGTATIASGGSITTVTGPMNFGKTNFNANGSITFTNTGMGFNGQVTAVVTGSSSDVNFSALSLTNNFSGITPTVTTTNNTTLYQAPGN